MTETTHVHFQLRDSSITDKKIAKKLGLVQPPLYCGFYGNDDRRYLIGSRDGKDKLSIKKTHVDQYRKIILTFADPI